MGHNRFIYIDDGISGHRTKQLACIAGYRKKSDLTRVGFIFCEKCNWEPHQIGVWLGLITDTIRFEFRIPQEKLDKLDAKLDEIIGSRFASFRFIAKLAGFLQSLHLAVGPVIRLFTRQMYFAIATRTYWDEKFLVLEPLQDELKFWRHYLYAFNGYSIRKKLSVDYVIFSDASSFGYGAYVDNSDLPDANGLWLEGEIDDRSTFRELKAIHNVVECYAPQIAHSKVKIYSDNQGACSIIEKGSARIKLNTLAIDIFTLSLKNDITLFPEWIPGSENESADILSKFLDKDDWKIHPLIFSHSDNTWEPHTVDRFSSYYNKQLSRFNSRFASPGSEAVDTLTQNWSFENNWVCPPVSLIIHAVEHFKKCRASGTSIIPEWKSAYFWPVIRQQPNKFADFVTDFRYLSKILNLIIPGPGQLKIYKSRKSVFLWLP